MANVKTIELGVLNIKTQPNSPEAYCELFEYLFTLKPLVKIWGSDYGTPGYKTLVDPSGPIEGISGVIYKYLEFDENAPWIDLQSGKPLVDKDGRPIPQVEGNKRPNAKDIEFVFYPRIHRLFFNAQKISPKRAQTLFAGLLNDEAIVKKHGVVDVEVESTKEAIERILRIPTITKLDIFFTRPNGDSDGIELEREFAERLEKQRIRRFEQNLSSEKSEGIEPDEETQAIMKVAITNGKVIASGFSGDVKVKESTVDHPRIERDKYDPDKQTLLSAMINFSSAIIRRTTQTGDRDG